MIWGGFRVSNRLTVYYDGCRDEPIIMSAGSKPPIAHVDCGKREQQQHIKGAAVL